MTRIAFLLKKKLYFSEALEVFEDTYEISKTSSEEKAFVCVLEAFKINLLLNKHERAKYWYEKSMDMFPNRAICEYYFRIMTD